MENLTDEEIICYENIPYTADRFALVVYGGCPLSICGVITNSILLMFFTTIRKREPQALYLAILAFLDIWTGLCYVLIFGIDAVALYYNSESLHYLWVHYIIPTFTVTEITQLAAPYIILSATVERYIMTAGLRFCAQLTTNFARYTIIVFILFVSTALRLCKFFELRLDEKAECTEMFGRYEIQSTSLMDDEYFKVFDSFVLPVFTTFIPVSSLLLLNFAVLFQLRAQQRRREQEKHRKVPSHENGIESPLLLDTNQPQSTARRLSQLVPVADVGSVFAHRAAQHRERRAAQDRVRSAAITLAAIVTSYLVCSSFALFIRIAERVKTDNSLMYIYNSKNKIINFTDFYTLSSDVISCMVTFNSFLRFFIYYICRKDLRQWLKITHSS